jgi:hypothetical protein
MSFIYIVIENSDSQPAAGGIFPDTYTTFEEAKSAILAKYSDILQEQCEDKAEIQGTPESKSCTYVYIEKGIHFYIHKLGI